uniref:Uncharacterized protein n=1 Tax=Schistocephalus solidus TaxID=70667 RepID=A0A0X3PC52_SCHSO
MVCSTDSSQCKCPVGGPPGRCITLLSLPQLRFSRHRLHQCLLQSFYIFLLPLLFGEWTAQVSTHCSLGGPVCQIPRRLPLPGRGADERTVGWPRPLSTLRPPHHNCCDCSLHAGFLRPHAHGSDHILCGPCCRHYGDHHQPL